LRAEAVRRQWSLLAGRAVKRKKRGFRKGKEKAEKRVRQEAGRAWGEQRPNSELGKCLDEEILQGRNSGQTKLLKL